MYPRPRQLNRWASSRYIVKLENDRRKSEIENCNSKFLANFADAEMEKSPVF